MLIYANLLLVVVEWCCSSWSMGRCLSDHLKRNIFLMTWECKDIYSQSHAQQVRRRPTLLSFPSLFLFLSSLCLALLCSSFHSFLIVSCPPLFLLSLFPHCALLSLFLRSSLFPFRGAFADPVVVAVWSAEASTSWLCYEACVDAGTQDKL